MSGKVLHAAGIADLSITDCTLHMSLLHVILQ